MKRGARQHLSSCHYHVYGKIKSLQCLSSVRKDIDTKVSTCKDHGFRDADSILFFGNSELPDQIKQLDAQYRNATDVSKGAFTFRLLAIAMTINAKGGVGKTTSTMSLATRIRLTRYPLDRDQPQPPGVRSRLGRACRGRRRPAAVQRRAVDPKARGPPSRFSRR